MSLLDEFTQGFANAIDDIRSKVVEQGWTGQPQSYGGSGGWADTKDAETPETNEIQASGIEAPEIGIDETDDIEPEIEDSNTDIMEMFTPPPEAEQGQELEQEGMDI